MPSSPPRPQIVRAHVLEIFFSGAAIILGLFLWVSMKDSNSGVNLLAGAALLVAGNYFVGSFIDRGDNHQNPATIQNGTVLLRQIDFRPPFATKALG